MKKAISNKQVADFYDNYVGQQVTYSKNLRHLFLLKKLKQLGINNSHSLLELGCGVGAVTKEIFKKLKPKNITGIDISPKSIEHAERINAGNSGNIVFILDDVCNLSLKQKYDYILIFDLLEHLLVEKHEHFFQGLHSFMKDDAKILLNIPYAGYLQFLIETEPNNVQIIEEPITISQLAMVLDKTGFEMEYLETYNLWAEYEYQYIIIKKKEKFELKWLPEKKWYQL